MGSSAIFVKPENIYLIQQKRPFLPLVPFLCFALILTDFGGQMQRIRFIRLLFTFTLPVGRFRDGIDAIFENFQTVSVWNSVPVTYLYNPSDNR